MNERSTKKTVREGEARDATQKWLASSSTFERASSTSFCEEYTQNLVALTPLTIRTKRVATT